MNQLEEKITENITTYFEKILYMSKEEMIKMREEIKEIRKERFRFSQEITKDISKDRIQLALSHLAKLFRRLDEEIKNQEKVQGNI